MHDRASHHGQSENHMTDPKIDIKQYIAKEELAAKAWFGTNWVPFAMGLVVGILSMVLLHKI